MYVKPIYLSDTLRTEKVLPLYLFLLCFLNWWMHY